MRTRPLQLSGLLLVLPVIFGSFGCGKGPTKGSSATPPVPKLPTAVTINGFPPPEPQLRGAVVGDLKPFSLRNPGFKESLLAHPLPKLRLVFALPGKNETVQVELPRAVDNALLDCWRTYLAHYYKVEMEPRGGLQARVNADMAFAAAGLRLDNQLQAITIKAPNGLRKISWGESGDVLHFLANSAQSVVQQARDQTRKIPLT